MKFALESQCIKGRFLILVGNYKCKFIAKTCQTLHLTILLLGTKTEMIFYEKKYLRGNYHFGMYIRTYVHV